MPDTTKYVGGQAVIEGVMMRGPNVYAVAVRTPSGEVNVDVRDAPRWGQRWAEVPLVRGVVGLAESLTLGMKALTWSANQTIEEEDEQLGSGALAVSITIAMAFFLALFIVLPALLTKAAGDVFSGGIAFTVAEGVLRLGMFLGYLLLIARIKDVKRLFQYHGAEHKAIAAYENGVQVTPEQAQKFSTQHVRCGTNFLLTVMVITILVYSMFGRPSWPVLVATRITFIPLIAGISYELIRYAARHMDKAWVRRAMIPGLALQRLTTREPSLDQLEVAIASLRAALTAEQLAEVDGRAVRPGIRIPGAAPLAVPRSA